MGALDTCSSLDIACCGMSRRLAKVTWFEGLFGFKEQTGSPGAYKFSQSQFELAKDPAGPPGAQLLCSKHNGRSFKVRA